MRPTTHSIAMRLIGASAADLERALLTGSGELVDLDVITYAHAVESASVGPRKTVLKLLERERRRQEREIGKAAQARAAERAGT